MRETKAGKKRRIEKRGKLKDCPTNRGDIIFADYQQRFEMMSVVKVALGSNG